MSPGSPGRPSLANGTRGAARHRAAVPGVSTPSRSPRCASNLEAVLPERGILASDLERERALAALRSHYADGRLSTVEFETRAAAAARARTRGELRRLFRDLPSDVGARAAGAARRIDRALLRAHVASYGTINGTWIAIWAMEGGGVFWPAVPLAAWGLVLLGHQRASRAVRRALPPRRLAR